MDVQENIFRRVSDDTPQNRVCRQVALLPPSTGLLSFPSGSRSSMSIDGYSERSLTAGHIARHMIGDVLTEGLCRSMFLAQHDSSRSHLLTHRNECRGDN
jgi:hypothetical protein